MQWIAVPSLLFSFAATSDADELRGRVVHIADGDTITVLDAAKVQHKIRLEGIDAPEKGRRSERKAKRTCTRRSAARKSS